MKEIFKWFTTEDADSRIVWFTEQFPYEEFDGIDKLFVLFLGYCASLNIPASKKFLEKFLQTEGKKYIKKYNIKLPTMDNFDYSEPTSLNEAARIIIANTAALYDEYVVGSLDTDDNFKVAMKAFIEKKKSDKVVNVMTQVFPQLSDGDVTELIDDMQYKLSVVQEIYNPNCLSKLDFLEGRTSSSGTKGRRMRHILNTGIPCIDGDAGGLFSTQVWALTGSPGIGKTRFALAAFAYQAMVGSKVDVLFEELELQKIEVENMLIAYHIIQLYDGKIKIPDSVMNKGLMSPEQEKYYEAARIDLFESGNYGRITIRTDSLIVETLEKNMLNYLRRNRNTQLWITDYAGLAKSKPTEKYAPHKIQFEIIQELYKTTKDIVKEADIGALIINQFGKEGIDAAKSGKIIVAGHVQGGQIIEQHADYDLALCATTEQEAANMCTLSTVKKRAAAGFQFVPFAMDRSVSVFRQLRQEAIS